MGSFAQIFAGLTFTAVCLAVAVQCIRHRKAPRVTVVIMVLAGAGLVKTWFEGFANNVASVIPGPLLAFAAVFCALGVVFDCWGKQNKAGKTTAIIGFFVPIMLVMAPVAIFGVTPKQMVTDIKNTTDNSKIITTSYGK